MASGMGSASASLTHVPSTDVGGVRLGLAAIKAGAPERGCKARDPPLRAWPQQGSAVPASAVPLDIRFGEIHLVGFETPNARYAPADVIPITLYWQADARSAIDYSLSLKAITNDTAVVGSVDSYPGWGSLRTSTWQTGVIYADQYLVPLFPDARGYSPLRINVHWWQYPDGASLSISENGQPVPAALLPVGAFTDNTPLVVPENLFTTPPVDFGNTFRLLGYDRRNEALTLLWEASTVPQENYTVFVQVLSEDGIVAQGDAPPVLPTQYLRTGEQFITQHTLTTLQTLQGTYPLVVGWYQGAQRLATDFPNDSFPLLEISVPFSEP